MTSPTVNRGHFPILCGVRSYYKSQIAKRNFIMIFRTTIRPYNSANLPNY